MPDRARRPFIADPSLLGTGRERLAQSHNLLRPQVIARKLRSARFRLRAAAGRGALPNALIIGAMKSGTTSLFDHLVQHPGVCGSRTKELHFFDNQHDKGERWYRAQFEPQGEPVLLEASPYYLFHPLAPVRASALVPDARLIVLLRDPVARAHSHYNQNVEEGRETLPFAEALDREEERLAGTEDALISGRVARSDAHQSFSYVGKSLYARQIRRWFDHFDPARFLFLRAEDLFASPQAVTDRAAAFLGLPPHPLVRSAAKNRRAYPPLDPAIRARLERTFAEPNAELERLVGIRWPRN